MLRSLALLVLFSPLAFLATGTPSAPAQGPAAKATAKDEPKKGIDRTGATRKRLLKDFGGSEEGEEAVMLGLAWLTQVQKADGGWVYDGGRARDTAPATGMAVLAFLGAGQSHKEGRYKQTVQAGLDWLIKDLETSQSPRSGHFKGAFDMYGQGIATLALCEAYAMTQDADLREPAQRALDYIQKGQGVNGSWGYQAPGTGDTSIVGWQVQALHAGQLAGLNVDDKVIKKAVAFLEQVSPGQTKSSYGYDNSGRAAPGTSLTAIGLLCRYYIDGWRRHNAAFVEGTKGLMKRAPKPDQSGKFPIDVDLYYYYYATQVVRFLGGDEWKDWNEGVKELDGTRKGGMPDWLISIQNRTRADRGSWNPPRDQWIGPNCGRLEPRASVCSRSRCTTATRPRATRTAPRSSRPHSVPKRSHVSTRRVPALRHRSGSGHALALGAGRGSGAGCAQGRRKEG
ncbi:MAG: prenyltransferase/squalene oxidase repeat-containing protein [Gemmataceae bacterium]